MLTLPAATPRARRVAIALAIGGALFLVYLLTFSGVPKTTDESYIVDTTDSMAVRGHLRMNQTAYLRPLQTSGVEPAQPVLSIPLYWLAYHTPWVGNVHALFLFSPIVTVLTAIVLFCYALDLGYGERTALASAFLFGLTTMAWPYAETYFREPLTTLNLFLAAFLFRRWRELFSARERRHWLYLSLGIAVTLVALLGKEATLVVLPVLFLIAYPGRMAIQQHRHQVIGIVIGILAIAILFGLALVIFRERLQLAVSRYDISTRLSSFLDGLPQAGEGLAGYLISPGKGIWWYSPVLLLALGAPVVLPRSRWRESWLMVGSTLWVALIYAAVRGPVWHGGAGWGVRYMLPLIPFLMVAALPLIDQAIQSTRLWPKLILAVLALWGLAIQIAGAYVDLYSYYGYLGEHIDLPPWIGPAVWSFRWSQAIGSLLFIGQAQTDVLWLIGTPDWAVIATIAGAIVLLGALSIWLHLQETLPRRLASVTVIGAPLIVTGVTLFALWRGYDDPRFKGGDETMGSLVAFLTENVKPDEPILVAPYTYVPYLTNYYKGRATWYAVPFLTDENADPPQNIEITPDRVEDAVPEEVKGEIALFSYGGPFSEGQPLWLVTDRGPWLAWATLPMEWYMNRYDYPVSVTDLSPYTRVIKYLGLGGYRLSEGEGNPVGVQLGDGMRLVEFETVTSQGKGDFDSLHAGDKLGISLLWEATASMDTDYTVAVFLVGPDGVPVLQHDRWPVGGFEPTSTWETGDRIRDNYGFILPEGLPTGHYQVWVLAYTWPSLERLPVIAADGAVNGDHIVLATFTVR